MGGHGPSRDLQAIGDLLVAEPAGDQLGDLGLSWRELAERDDRGLGISVVKTQDDLAAELDVGAGADRRHVDAKPVHERAVGGAQVDDGESVVEAPDELGVSTGQSAALDAQRTLGGSADDDRFGADVDTESGAFDGDDRDSAGGRDTSVDGSDRGGAVARGHGSSVGGNRGGCQDGELRRGEQIGRYLALDPLGSGGAGTVYRAFDPDLERSVAIKVLRIGGPQLAREALLHEARALASVVHPNVVTIHDVGLWREQLFVAMELLEGSSLSQWRERTRPRYSELLQVFDATASGLRATHEAGLLHRDVKPSNIVLSAQGVPKLVDFGLAVDPDAYRPRSDGSPAGTWRYLAPELRAGQAPSRASDLYALCLTFSEVFDEPGVQAPRWLRTLLRQGIAAEPELRPASVEELQTAVRRRVARRRWLMGGGVLAGVVAVSSMLVGSQPTPEDVAAQELRSRSTLLRTETRADEVLTAWRQQEPDRAEGLRRDIAAFEQSWRGAYADYLARRQRDGASSERLVELRCLDRAWRRHASVLRMGLSSPEHFERLSDTVGMTEAPSLCGDTSNLMVDLPRPSDPRQADAVDSMRQEVEDVVDRADFLDPEMMLAELEAIEPRLSALGFEPLIGEFQAYYAYALHNLGDFARAAEAAEVAVLSAARSGHALVLMRSTELLLLGLVELGRLEAADAWARRGLADAEAIPGLGVERAGILRAAALVARKRGDLNTAERRLRAGLDVLEEFDDELSLLAELQTELALLHANRREAGPAIEAGRAAVASFEADRGPFSALVTHALVNLGRTTSAVGRDLDAIAVLQEAVERYADLPDPLYQPLAHSLLATAQMRVGDLQAAEANLDRAESLATNAGSAILLARVFRARAAMAEQHGDSEARVSWEARAMEAVSTLGNRARAASMLGAIAEGLLEQGRCIEAAELLAEHGPLLIEAGVRVVIAQARLEVCEGRAQVARERLLAVRGPMSGTTAREQQMQARVRFALHEASMKLGDREAAVANLTELFDAPQWVFDEARWSRLVLDAAALGFEPDPG